MIQRLPIALAQIKAGNTSENLLNEICQIYILCIVLFETHTSLNYSLKLLQI